MGRLPLLALWILVVIPSLQAVQKGYYDNCRTNKACFGYRLNEDYTDCVLGKNCTYMVTVQVVDGTVNFQLIGQPFNIPGYVALGLGHSLQMGNLSVVECVLDRRGSVSMFQSYTNGSTNSPRINNQEEGLVNSSLEGNKFSDGDVICNFSRPLTYTVTVSGSGVKDTYNLIGDTFYLSLVSGGLLNGTDNEIDVHDPTFITMCKINITDVKADTVCPTQSQYRPCGDTKVCVGFNPYDPNGADCVQNMNCSILLRTERHNDSLHMELAGTPLSDPGYIAVGLGPKHQMGEASVVECVTARGTIDYYQSYTNATYGSPRLQDKTESLVIRVRSMNHYSISCLFTRPLVYNITEPGSKTNVTFNLLSQLYHVSLVSGPLRNGSNPGQLIAKHYAHYISGLTNITDPSFIPVEGTTSSPNSNSTTSSPNSNSTSSSPNSDSMSSIPNSDSTSSSPNSDSMSSTTNSGTHTAASQVAVLVLTAVSALLVFRL